MSVEQLSILMEKKREEVKESVVCSDAMMLGNGYLDTTKGMVLTSDNALALIRDKVEKGRAASLAKVIEANRKAVEAARRLEKHCIEVARMRALEMRRRAAMSRMRVNVFRAQCRSLKERRALARMGVKKRMQDDIGKQRSEGS